MGLFAASCARGRSRPLVLRDYGSGEPLDAERYDRATLNAKSPVVPDSNRRPPGCDSGVRGARITAICRYFGSVFARPARLEYPPIAGDYREFAPQKAFRGQRLWPELAASRACRRTRPRGKAAPRGALLLLHKRRSQSSALDDFRCDAAGSASPPFVHHLQLDLVRAVRDLDGCPGRAGMLGACWLGPPDDPLTHSSG
jgi:hypothetical protein